MPSTQGALQHPSEHAIPGDAVHAPAVHAHASYDYRSQMAVHGHPIHAGVVQGLMPPAQVQSQVPTTYDYRPQMAAYGHTIPVGVTQGQLPPGQVQVQASAPYDYRPHMAAYGAPIPAGFTQSQMPPAQVPVVPALAPYGYRHPMAAYGTPMTGEVSQGHMPPAQAQVQAPAPYDYRHPMALYGSPLQNGVTTLHQAVRWPTAFHMPSALTQGNQQSHLGPVPTTGVHPDPRATVPTPQPPGAPPPTPVQAHATMAPYLTPMVPYLTGQPLTSSRLPRLELPTFDGSPSQFVNFWESFRAGIDARPLPAVEKCTHLFSLLRGDAALEVKGLMASAESYAIALQTLQARFGHPDDVRQALHQELGNIPPCPERCSYGVIRSTMIAVEALLRQLQTMGDDVHHPQLLQVVERLLPPEFLGKVWERCHEPRTLQETRLVIAALLNKQERLKRVRPVTSKIAPAVTTTTLATAVRPRRPPKSKAPEEQANAATEHRTTTTPRAPQPATRPIRPCLFCTSAEHSTTGCTEHSTVAQREERLRVLNRCPRCLASAHQTEECNVRRAPCYICQQLGHHPALCPERQHTRSPRTTQVAAVSVSQPEAFLPLASVRVHNGLPTSPTATPWILLDACSESNFISTELATRLQLTATEATTMTIGTMGERSHTVYAERYTVYLRQDDGSDKAVQCWAVDTLLQPLRHVENASAKVEMLLGIDTYFDVVHGCPQRLPSGLYQVDTTLGTLTCGKQDDTYRVQVAHISLLDKQEAALDQLLERQWGLDAIGIVDDPHEIDDDRALALLNASVTRDGEGRYHVSLPRRPVPSQFGDNFGLAYARLVSVARQLQGHDAESWTTYAAIIRQQLDAGIIEQVNERVPDNTVRYIPHHMVFGKKKRIVYDASARQGKSGSSLNDMLYRGPLLLHNLAGILLRSRLSRLLISADVEKAFLMIGIHETDRDLLRFVFLKDPSRPPTRDNIQIYRFCRLPFGLNCAPFVLNAVVRHHLATSGSPLAAVIANDIYADNIFLRVDTQAEATQHCATAKQLFADACMNLREFRSNNAAVNTAFSDPESPTTIKVLGIEWDSAADAFSIPFPPRDNMPATKQSVCSFIAKVYDPLGWVSPTLVAARQILQYLHQSEYSWTTALTATDQARWNRVMEPLDAYRYTIPRYPGSFNETATLHIFCDASKHHYATAAYLVLSTAPPCLLMAKSRIVPVSMKCSDQKRFAFITIPRLELMALHLGSMLLRFLRQELPAIQNAVIWTDSTPALGWVHSAPETVLPVFVDNRVRVIREVRVPVRYVPTACNPADIATRGLTPSQLSESTLWHHGPAWLAQPQSEWPAQPNISVTAVTTLSPADDFTIVDLNASNRLLTLVRAQALAHRAAARFLRQRATTPLMRNIQAWSANVAELTTEELAAARQALLTQAQQAFPPADKYRRCLQADAHGILRYLSRLTNSELKQATTHPAFLDPRSPLATLMVLQIHDDLHHSGIITTHNELRQTLWIPQGRRLVHQLLRKCVPCRRRTAAPFTAPPMPDLPPSRVTQARPFEHSGLDYFGPCHVRLPNSSQYSSKCWVALFTCLTTRAVHLEPVLSSSGAACLAAFRRFIARRGRPTTMLSDNATAFVLVARLVERVWPVTELPLEATNTLQRFCADKGIRWSHITAHAPWQGGAWERLVGVVKNPLKATLGRQLVDFDEFVTLLTEVEQVVNLRPLVMGSTIEDHPLRPIDFLMPMGVPSPIALELPRTVTDTTTASELIALWQSSEDALNVFWKEFHAGYLLQLRDRMDRTLRQPRSQTGRRPIVDEVVLIRDDAVPRNQWRLGRICALDQSTDGEIRSVGVRPRCTPPSGQASPARIFGPHGRRGNPSKRTGTAHRTAFGQHG